MKSTAAKRNANRPASKGAKATPAKKSASAKTSSPTASKNGSKNGASKNGSSKKAAEPKDMHSKLHELFVEELKDIYWAEKALTKAIPKMIKKATSDDLIEALETHLEETEGQVERLESVFELLGKPAQAKKCEAMAGLIKEAEEIMEESEEGVMRDAGIISAGQKVEHYEIATYGTLCQFAKTLGLNEIKDILGRTLNEEKNADEKLSEVAESAINVQAAQEPVEA